MPKRFKNENRDRASFGDYIATEFDCLSAALFKAAEEVEKGKQIQAFMNYCIYFEERWERLVNKTRDIEDRLGINLLDVEKFDPDEYEIIVTVNRINEEEDDEFQCETELDPGTPSEDDSDGQG